MVDEQKLNVEKKQEKKDEMQESKGKDERERESEREPETKNKKQKNPETLNDRLKAYFQNPDLGALVQRLRDTSTIEIAIDRISMAMKQFAKQVFDNLEYPIDYIYDLRTKILNAFEDHCICISDEDTEQMYVKDDEFKTLFPSYGHENPPFGKWHERAWMHGTVISGYHVGPWANASVECVIVEWTLLCGVWNCALVFENFHKLLSKHGKFTNNHLKLIILLYFIHIQRKLETLYIHCSDEDSQFESKSESDDLLLKSCIINFKFPGNNATVMINSTIINTILWHTKIRDLNEDGRIEHGEIFDTANNHGRDSMVWCRLWGTRDKRLELNLDPIIKSIINVVDRSFHGLGIVRFSLDLVDIIASYAVESTSFDIVV